MCNVYIRFKLQQTTVLGSIGCLTFKYLSSKINNKKLFNIFFKTKITFFVCLFVGLKRVDFMQVNIMNWELVVFFLFQKCNPWNGFKR